jgi:hypothetical protein
MLVPIVRFFVPVGSEKSGRCGTGFPISENLILTAYHVVHPEDRNEKPIQVNWYARGMTERGSEFRPIDAIVYCNQTLDFAIIKCERPAGIEGYANLQGNWPTGLQNWQSAGFIIAGGQSVYRAAEPFSGKVQHEGYGGSFRIDTIVKPSDENLKDGEAWRGASGMPVCLSNTNNVIGLVVTVQNLFAGNRLDVVPSHNIIRDEGFKNAIRDNDGEYQALLAGRRNELADQVNEILKLNPIVLDVLVKKFMPKEAGISSTGIRPEDLTKRILDASIADLGLGLRLAIIHLDKPKRGPSEEKNKLADAIRSIGYLVGPFRFGALHGEFVREYFKKKPGKLAKINALSPLAFELLMAEVDEREVETCKRVQGSGAYPAGTRSFSELPEFGRIDQRERIKRVVHEIQQKLRPGSFNDEDVPQLGNSVVQAIGAVIWPEIDSSEADTESRKTILNLKLGAKTVGKGRYYFPIRLPEDGGLRNVLESELNKVAEWLNEFVFIGYESSSVVELNEAKQLELFSQIIPEAEERPA